MRNFRRCYRRSNKKTADNDNDNDSDGDGDEEGIDIMAVPVRSGLQPGMTVDIVLKKDQRTGTLTRGVIVRLLTKSPQHPHGIKVMLEDGVVGRVKKILTAEHDIDNDNE